MAGLSDKGDSPESTTKTEGMVEQFAFKSRFVLVFGEVDHSLAQRACERLIALAQESDAPISVLVSSPGGHVGEGFGCRQSPPWQRRGLRPLEPFGNSA